MFHQELVRFDAVVAEVVPEAVQSMGSGLNDEGVRALRTIIAPMDLGEDIEQLYRWHDGSALSVLAASVCCRPRRLSGIENSSFARWNVHPPGCNSLMAPITASLPLMCRAVRLIRQCGAATHMMSGCVACMIPLSR